MHTHVLQESKECTSARYFFLLKLASNEIYVCVIHTITETWFGPNWFQDFLILYIQLIAKITQDKFFLFIINQKIFKLEKKQNKVLFQIYQFIQSKILSYLIGRAKYLIQGVSDKSYYTYSRSYYNLVCGPINLYRSLYHTGQLY